MDFSKIPILILFIITLVCAVANSNFKAYYIKKSLRNESEQYSLNAGISLVCALTLFLLNGCRIQASWYSVLLGLGFGIVTMGSTLFQAKAVKIGPFGYTSVIISLSTAITALSGALFWNETLNAFKIIGIALMLVSFFFAIDTENKNGKKANIKWFLLCLFALLTCALIGLMQKIHQSSQYKNESTAFLFVAFLTSAVISFVGYIFIKKREKGMDDFEVPSKSLQSFFIALIVCGIGTAGNNVLNLYLSGVTDTAIFFPIVNGVPLLASLIVSFLIFKEKLKKKQLIGLSIGIIAIVCLCI